MTLAVVVLSLVANREVRGVAKLPVVFDPCVGELAQAVQRLIDIELSTLSSASLPTAQAYVLCELTGAVTIRIDDPLTNKTLARTLDLSRVAASARVRALALAVVELLAASWTELDRPTVSETQAVTLQPRVQDRAMLRANVTGFLHAKPPSRWLCTLGVAYSSALGDFSAAPNLTAQASFAFSAPFVAFTQFQAGRRFAATPDGDIHWDALTWMGGLGLAAKRGRFVVGAYAGPKLAAGQIAGRPADAEKLRAREFAALLLAASAHVVTAVRVYDGLWLQLSLDRGWVITPVTTRLDGVAVAKLEGSWISGHGGLGWAF